MDQTPFNSKSMLEARVENFHNMRNHFHKALGELGLGEDILSSNQGKYCQGIR